MTTPAGDLITLPGARPATAASLPSSSPPVHGAPLAVVPRPRPSGPVVVPDDLPATSPVVEPAEDSSRWCQHLQAVFDDFAPQGRVEQLLTFRVASLLWRLDRPTRVETAELSHAHAGAEDDAARRLASEDQLAPTAGAVPTIPLTLVALRQYIADAQLAVAFVPTLLDASGPDPLPDNKASAALRFCADYASSSTSPPSSTAPLPSPPPVGHWTAASLRTAISHFFPNRSMGDYLPEVTAFARTALATARDRLAQIDVLAARLRHQLFVSHSHTAAQAMENESHLAALLDVTLRQLLTLQAARA